MTTLRAQDFYHTCLIVEDLDDAIGFYAGLAGYRFMDPVERAVSLWSPRGPSEVTLRMTYSHDARLELVAQVPGTPWALLPGNAIHHIGYCVDDVVAASQGLIDAGAPLEICSRDGDRRPAGFAYHRAPGGVRIEVISRESKAFIDVMLQACTLEEE